MISAILIYGGNRGEVLASRIYKDGLRRAITDAFRVQVISNPENKSPLLTLGSTSFLHIRHGELYIVAVTRHDVDAMLVYEFLYKLTELCVAQFGTFDEQACHKNITLLYELLDELVDFGYPQNTDADAVKQLLAGTSNSNQGSSLFPRSLMPKSNSAARSQPTSSTNQATQQATGAVSWRREGIKYRRNEVFVDIFENFNLLTDLRGNIISSTVDGKIQVNSHLSGMPQCRIGLNDQSGREIDPEYDDVDDKMGPKSRHTVKITDFQLHQCVDLARFNRNRTILFVPPDGEFELMRYQVTDNLKPPIDLQVDVDRAGSSIHYRIKARTTFESKLVAGDVTIYVPVPPNTTKVNSNGTGKTKYQSSDHRVMWKIGRFTGGTDASFESTVNYTPSNTSWNSPPIQVEFSLSQYCGSGLSVRYLKVEDKSNYTALKWVRYLTRAGSYETRI